MAILQKLVAEEGHALVVARAAGGTFVKQWEGIGALIGRKMDMERKYIARLEGGWHPRGFWKGGGGGVERGWGGGGCRGWPGKGGWRSGVLQGVGIGSGVQQGRHKKHLVVLLECCCMLCLVSYSQSGCVGRHRVWWAGAHPPP